MKTRLPTVTPDLRPYPEYRDSGIPWLGTIPKHWGVARSKLLFTERKERALPDDEQLSATQSHGVIRQSDYERHIGRKLTRILLHLEKRRHVEKDDFVISMRSFQGGLERAWCRGAIRSSYVVLKPGPEVHVPYFAHLFKSHSYIQALRATSDFIRDGQDLTFWNFCLVDLPVVPADEQKAIASYLDSNAERVRRFIRNRRRLIEVLNEQKQAIIDRAITRGLDPNVRLKPSGIDWLGDVPEHWEVTRIKYLFRESDARSGDGSGLLLSLSRRRGLVPHQEVSERPPSASDLSKYKVCRPGELVMNRMQAWSGMFAAADQEGIISPDYCVFVPKRPLDVRYFELLFKTRLYVDRFIVASKGIGSGFNRLYTPDFGAIPVVFPPQQEQQRLLGRIDEECVELNSLISRTEREIDLVLEYRTRLIADVVTGKVDVRHLAPDAVEAASEEPEPWEEGEDATEAVCMAETAMPLEESDDE